MAEEFPEIKYFEPYNEINVSKGSGLERYGIAWDAEENDAYKFSIEERAGIMADLCWYVSKAVKSVDRANQVTTPSLSVDNNHSHVEGDFLDALYKAIESGNYPRYNDVADTRIDNFFTIINLHAYVEYTESNSIFESFDTKAQTKVNEWADRIAYAYNIAKAHNDGGSRVWLTETGMSTYHPDGEPRDEDNVAAIITKSLNKLDTALTFVDTVIFYEIADKSTNAGASAVETHYGLFYAYDDLDFDPYTAKPSAKAVYSFFNGGTSDYSALDALAARYSE
ncbi:MAG: hypothetical protein E7562_06055 [Ruminococcaceae bacterium]|nr:hypothetical protein [Oscillospiraceae bacterium]